MSAALVSLPEISELLLEAGADVMALNSTQSTPLFSACKANNPILAQKLIERGLYRSTYIRKVNSEVNPTMGFKQIFLMYRA